MDKNKNLIRLSKSCIGQAEKRAVLNVLDKEFLGMGEEVQIFENHLSKFLGRPVVCVGSGTAALHLALQACGVGFGDEVLIPSITYVASFQAISATGATPIACDVDASSLCLDWKDAEKRISDNTKAIMPVHYSGGVGQLDKIYEFAEQYKIRVIEDAAHAFGTIYREKRVGGFGDISCFSFDGIKNITSGEGGCIVSDDKSVLDLCRDARLLGVIKDTEKRYQGKRSWDFQVVKQGWRYHMSNIMAAIGIEQLKRFDSIANKRKVLANRYVEKLKDCKCLNYINHNYDEVVPHIFPIILSSRVNREKLINQLNIKNIQVGIHYKPNHLLQYFCKNSQYPLTKCESIYQSLMTLPLHENLNVDEVIYICDSLISSIETQIKCNKI